MEFVILDNQGKNPEFSNVKLVSNSISLYGLVKPMVGEFVAEVAAEIISVSSDSEGCELRFPPKLFIICEDEREK